MSKKGTKPEKLYEIAVGNGKQDIPPPALATKVSHFDYRGSPISGKSSAAVKIAVFKDFQCPYCIRISGPLKQVQRHYGDKVAIVFKHYPLSNQCNPSVGRDMHPGACLATYWSMAAEAQGKFKPFAEAVFTNMDTMIPRQGVLRDRLAAESANMKRYAAQVGLDVTKATAYVAGRGYKGRLDKDLREASEAGVSGTPAIFINGRSYKGAMTVEKLKETVDGLLSGKI